METCKNCACDRVCDHNWNGFETCGNWISMDSVPVVFCQECKWWHEDDDIGYCDNHDGLDNYAKPDDFCSYGEKEGAE